MRKIESAATVLAFVLALGTGLASLPAAAANHCGGQQQMMDQGQLPMMGRGQGPMMGRGQGPMMGRDQGPMMGRALIPTMGRGWPIPAVRDLSADDVRGHLER